MNAKAHSVFIVLSLLIARVSVAQSVDVPVIAVSVKPLALVVAAICAKECKAEAVIPAGVSEHHWEASPRDILRFRAAVAGVGVGLRFDEALFRKVMPSLEKKKLVFYMGDKARPRRIAPEHKTSHEGHQGGVKHGHDHDHGEFDPHIWFDPNRMAEIVPQIATNLAQVLPASAQKLKTQGDEFVKVLRSLDDEIKGMQKTWQKKPVIVFHDALGYWAEQYAQDIHPLVSGGSGREISVKTFGNLVREFKGKNVGAVVVEKPEGTATNLARDLGTKVIQIDFGNGPNVDQSYEAWLRRFAAAWGQVVR